MAERSAIDDKSTAAYLDAAIAVGDVGLVVKRLRDVARARGLPELVQDLTDTPCRASNGLSKLARTFSTQVETLKKYRSDGQQTIKVQHVTVKEGGQAIVGNVQTGGGVPAKNERHPHEPSIGSERSAPMLGYVEAIGQALPSTGLDGLERVPVPRSEGRSANGEG